MTVRSHLVFAVSGLVSDPASCFSTLIRNHIQTFAHQLVILDELVCRDENFVVGPLCRFFESVTDVVKDVAAVLHQG